MKKKPEIAVRFFLDICESKFEDMLEVLTFQLYRELQNELGFL